MKKIIKFCKKNWAFLIVFVIGIIITAASTFYAAETIFASNQVSYDNSNSTLTSTNVQAALDELYTNITTLMPDTPFRLGDYFTMVPDYSGTFIITAGTIDDSLSDQTITPSELTLWRIIDIHSDGSVDAVSEYVSSTAVYFQGTTGYANCVGALQTIAAQYAKAGYTINTRMMGYGGQTLTIQPKSSNCTGTCQTTTTYAFDGSTNTAPSGYTIFPLDSYGYYRTPSPYTGVGQEYNGGVLGDTLYLKDIQLVGNIYKTDTTKYGDYGLKAYLVNDTATNGDYWLASRRFAYVDATLFNFNARSVVSGSLYSNALGGYSNRWVNVLDGNSVRPIITLKSGIQITGGEGTITEPYTITA